MSNWQEKAREVLHQRHGCAKTLDEHTSAVNLTSVYYCLRHMCGWLHDVDACAHVDAAVDSLAPVVEAERRRHLIAFALSERKAATQGLQRANAAAMMTRAEAFIEAGDPR